MPDRQSPFSRETLQADVRVQVTIGFIAHHKSVPVIDFRYLGAPSTLTLDPDPWYSKFDNPNLKRHHKDALMSFVYVEPYEVRHEILARVKDLREWMDLGLRGDQYIEIDELESLKQRIGEFLLEKNLVTVDGVALKPILDRTNYVKVGLTGIRILEVPAAESPLYGCPAGRWRPGQGQGSGGGSCTRRAAG